MQEFKSANQRWMDRVAPPPIPVTQSVFPEDAAAIIYKLARSPMRAARPRPQWKLRFEPRAPRVIEPLMGWTAAQDTLPQVELSFPSAEAAVAYARRHGLRYVLHSDGDIDATVHRLQDAKRAGAAKPQPGSRPWRLEWIERTLGADVVHNARRSQPDQSFARYASPQDVMGDPTLSEAEKRDVLRRWALDAYLIECSLSRGETVPHPSRLDEVVDALIDLDEVNRQLISTHLSKAASQQNAA